jgi:hypothetical protein
MFYTAAGNLTDWHFDFQENFTVQLSGSKRWRFAKSPVSSPLRGHQPHYDSAPDVVERQLKAARLCPEASRFPFSPPASLLASNNSNHQSVPPVLSSSSAAAATASSSPSLSSGSLGANSDPEVQEVVLVAGDVLYFPAGMWHAVECVEAGVSLNVSLMASSWADLTASAVKHALSASSVCRAALCPTPLPPQMLPRENSDRSSSSSAAGAAGGGDGDTSSSKTEAKTKAKKKRSGGGSSSSSSATGLASCDAARATASAVLAELRAVADRLTVDDLLPLVLSHPAAAQQHHDRLLASQRQALAAGSGGSGGAASGVDEEEMQTPPPPPSTSEGREEVDLSTFDLPSREEAEGGGGAGGTMLLRANPLADVLEEDDLTRYYREQRALRGEEEPGANTATTVDHAAAAGEVTTTTTTTTKVWVVNVNFGNEGLQSIVRVRLRCSAGLDVKGLWSFLRGHNNDRGLDDGCGGKLRLNSISVKSECERHQLRGGTAPTTAEIKKLLGALSYFGALSPV